MSAEGVLNVDALAAALLSGVCVCLSQWESDFRDEEHQRNSEEKKKILLRTTPNTSYCKTATLHDERSRRAALTAFYHRYTVCSAEPQQKQHVLPRKLTPAEAKEKLLL